MSLGLKNGGSGGISGTIEAHILAWMEFEQIERGRQHAGVLQYAGTVRRFLAWLAEKWGVRGDEIDPKSVTRAEIRDYMKALFYDLKNLRGSSRANKLSALRSFFGYLKYAGVIVADPTDGIPTPRFEKPTPTKFTTEDLRLLFSAPAAGTVQGRRDVAILKTLYGAGLRISELAGLNISDVTDFGHTRVFLHVRGKGAKQRTVPMDREPSEAVKGWIAYRVSEGAGRESPLFTRLRRPGVGQRLGVGGIANVLKKYGRMVGIADAEIFAHKMRATWATDLYDSGHDRCPHCGRAIRKTDLLEIAVLAGWSDPKTARRYIAISERVLRKTMIPPSRWRELRVRGDDGGEVDG